MGKDWENPKAPTSNLKAKAAALISIADASGMCLMAACQGDMVIKAEDLRKSREVLQCICQLAPKDPSEYGQLRKLCITRYADLLATVAEFQDAGMEVSTKEARDRLCDFGSILSEYTTRWWFILRFIDDPLTGQQSYATQAQARLEISLQQMRGAVGNPACTNTKLVSKYLGVQTSVLCVIACGLGDLLHGITLEQPPPYDVGLLDSWLRRCAASEQLCKPTFRGAGLSTEFQRLLRGLAALNMSCAEKDWQSRMYVVAAEREVVLDKLQNNLETICARILTEEGQVKYSSMFLKDLEDIEALEGIKALPLSMPHDEPFLIDVPRGRKVWRLATVHAQLRTAVIVSAASWLLLVSRFKTGSADTGASPFVKGNTLLTEKEAEELCNIRRNIKKKQLTKEGKSIEVENPGLDACSQDDILLDGRGYTAAELERHIKRVCGDLEKMDQMGRTKVSAEVEPVLLEVWDKGVRLCNGTMPPLLSADFIHTKPAQDPSLERIDKELKKLEQQIEATAKPGSCSEHLEEMHSTFKIVEAAWPSVGTAGETSVQRRGRERLGFALLGLGTAVCHLMDRFLEGVSGPKD